MGALGRCIQCQQLFLHILLYGGLAAVIDEFLQILIYATDRAPMEAPAASAAFGLRQMSSGCAWFAAAADEAVAGPRGIMAARILARSPADRGKKVRACVGASLPHSCRPCCRPTSERQGDQAAEAIARFLTALRLFMSQAMVIKYIQAPVMNRPCHEVSIR